MVENRNLRKALFHRLQDLETVRMLAPASIAALDRNPHGVQATLADGRGIRARLAVAADGRGSQTRDRAGIKVTNWSYEQFGIVCTVAHEKCHDFVANEHFLPAGPFAILPLKGDKDRPGHCSSIVWTERAALTPAIMALDDAAFQIELERRFGDVLGPIADAGHDRRIEQAVFKQYTATQADSGFGVGRSQPVAAIETIFYAPRHGPGRRLAKADAQSAPVMAGNH